MEQAVRVRIYCDQSDRAGHTSLANAVVQILWKRHASGVTVINAVEGFGARHRLHSAHLVDLGGHAPVLIEWLERPERFDELWPELEPLLAHAVVTRENVEMLVGPHQPQG